jgi:hypothetical protein
MKMGGIAMVDIQREKYLKLMLEIEELEDELEQYKTSGSEADKIKEMTELLIDKRNELKRISDGCG